MKRDAWDFFILFLRWVVTTFLIVGLLFGIAGRRDLPMFWAYSAVFSLLGLTAIFTIDPDLARERRHPGPGGIDRIRGLVVGFLFLVHLVIAALDVGQYHWSDTVPLGLQIVGLTLFTASFGLVIWAMAVNRFFSPVVRIQKERGHHLVNEGPYRRVRHPGYIGMCVGVPSSALALGSWWSLVPAAPFALLILRRAVLEDRYLQENLDGYRGYTETVRYRLVPGIW